MQTIRQKMNMQIELRLIIMTRKAHYYLGAKNIYIGIQFKKPIIRLI